MWSSRDPDRRSVDCPACGQSVPRTQAREYDKFGDRWDRRGKTFEHLCRGCHEDLCHQGRKGLEELLLDLGAGQHEDREFLRRYARAVEDQESVDS
jgi:hypothetical protein